MKKLYILLAFFFCGCNEEEEEKIMEPPQFSRGDQVVVRPYGKSVGIIFEAFEYEENWEYKIMFKDTDMVYKEKDLKLIKRFEWFLPEDFEWFPEKIQAEIEFPPSETKP